MLSSVRGWLSAHKLGLAFVCLVGLAACSNGSSDDTPDTPAVEIPGTPLNIVVTEGDERVIFTFDAPTTGGRVNRYTVTCDANDQETASRFSAASPVTISGMVNDVTYTCTIVASNTAGDGPAVTVSATPSDPFQTTDCALQTTDGGRITCQTHNLLADMTNTQRSAILRALDEGNATDFWSDKGVATDGRLGISPASLSDEQVVIFDELLDAILSDQGQTLLDGVRAGDGFLGETTTGFGSGLYYISFHGTPSYSDPWMVQFSGHNYNLFASINGDYVGLTPHFVGIEPISFTFDSVDYEPMKPRRDALIALLASLSSTELSTAETSEVFDDVVLLNDEDGNFPTPSGLDVDTLDASKRALVVAAITAFSDDQQGGALSADYTTDSALDDTFILWSGDADLADQGAYIRIDGPRVWIELALVAGDATSDVNIHSIWRDKALDYGDNFDLTD
tara:strand:+ start:21123 stop:22478 length:1356 start_codon:yes stop_codon:yes gene_type:complete